VKLSAQDPEGRLSSRFSDRLVAWSWILPALMFVLACYGSCSGRVAWEGRGSLMPEGELTSPLIALDPPALGAYRLEAQAYLAPQRWAALQFGLETEDGKTLVEAGREVWDEQGTWYEDGQSGTWRENDTDFMLEARLAEQKKVRVVVELLEIVRANSTQPLDEPVTVQVRLLAGVMDGRWLWFGFIATAVMVLFIRVAAARGGDVVVSEGNADSEVKGRAVMGGKGRLVHLRAVAVSDETTPQSRMRLRVVLRDEAGETLLDHAYTPSVSPRFDDEDLDSVILTLNLYFALPRRTSYGLWVEVLPDDPVDRIRLIVRDGHRPASAVPVISFADAEAEHPVSTSAGPAASSTSTESGASDSSNSSGSSSGGAA